ncbi:WhiB family transcriptional regulator [Streptomyces sp. MNP-20]|uniref:WhiB family transcriptional regulator n=1 Tax=Streptomyces sp. MNP-20 TaxID=2721165 RepID=UPI001C1E2AD8|nr:WhiB family transcriptional regulator [Streptomyces sp. MNP-20]
MTARAGATTAPAAGPRPDAWQDDGICAQTDPESFFPTEGRSARPAKKICAGCPVRHECRAYALARPELYGIWGGLTRVERGRLRGRTAA